MPEGSESRTPGWYDDPIIVGQQRRWDGIQWTNEVRQTPTGPTATVPAGPAGVAPAVTTAGTGQDDRQEAKKKTRMVGLIIALAGAGIAAIGCIGPWATVGIFEQNGMDADGQLVLPILIISAIVAGIGLTQEKSNVFPIASAALCGLAALIGLIDMADVRDNSTTVFDTEISASIGWGLWLVVIGSVTGAGGGTYAVMAGPSEPRAPREGEVLVSTLRLLDPPVDRAEGWKPDPLDQTRLRWWDGEKWIAKVGLRKPSSE